MGDFTGAVFRSGGASGFEGLPLRADAAPPKDASGATEHRLNFVFRVYGMLSLQNTVVVLTALGALFLPGVGAYVKANIWLPVAAGVVFVGVAAPLFFMRDSGALQRQPWSSVALAMFVVVEAVLVACVGLLTGTNTLLYFMGLNALTLGASALFAVQQRFDFTPIFGLMLTALCGLLFVGTLSSILGLALGGFVWGAVASIVYCVVVMVHSEFTMRAIASDSVSMPKTAALVRVDAAAAALKINVDILAVVPFLYGIVRVCCPQRAPKSS